MTDQSPEFGALLRDHEFTVMGMWPEVTPACAGCDWTTERGVQPDGSVPGDLHRAHVAEVIEREYVAARVAEAKAEAWLQGKKDGLYEAATQGRKQIPNPYLRAD